MKTVVTVSTMFALAIVLDLVFQGTPMFEAFKAAAVLGGAMLCLMGFIAALVHGALLLEERSRMKRFN